jgi:catechol 2,3-dioxygenase-like lactoylglutathione lyase family enzyme
MPKVQAIYHTGFVVSDLDRSLEFYTGLLGLSIERQPVTTDTPWLAEVVGYESVKMRMAYVGVGDGHSIELIEYVLPRGEARSDQFERNKPGSAHAAMVVDDVPTWREKLEVEGFDVFGPTSERDLEYPWARYAIYFQDPDGNWLEMVSRDPKPAGSTDN